MSQLEPLRLSKLDLDERIILVDQRLIERKERMHRNVDAIGLGVRRAVRPWRRALPAIGLMLAVTGLVGWLRPRRPHVRDEPAAVRHARQARRTAPGEGIPWMHLMTLGWPLLPAAWRSRISPATASTLVALGLPLLEGLRRARQRPAPQPVQATDLPRFAGTWFVSAQLPGVGKRGAGQPTLRYALHDEDELEVIATTPSLGPAGTGEAVRGRAHVVPGSGGAKLRLSLWPEWLRGLASAWSDHWILHVDENYQEALVGSASRDRLWVLSRQPRLDEPRLSALVERAREQGFAVERLEFMHELNRSPESGGPHESHESQPARAG